MSEEEKKTEQKTNTSDLIAYRKKQKKKSRRIKLCIGAALLLVGIIVASNFEAIVEPLRGIASKIDTKTSDSVGFPIKLPGSATYSFGEFGENFLLLTDTYLYAFGNNGGQLYALRHGYTNPVSASNSKRVLLCDKNYTSFSFYSKTSKIYEQTTEDRILFGAVSDGDMAAVVTDSAKYTNVVTVYDGSGNWRYKRKFIDENVMCVDFSDDQRYIYIAVIGTLNGSIYTTIYKFDINSEDNEVWQKTIVSNSVPCMISTMGSNLGVVFDNRLVTLTQSTGEELGTLDFSGTLLSAEINDSGMSVLYTDKSSNRTRLAVIKSDGAVSAQVSQNSGIAVLARENDNTYIIDNRTVRKFNFNAEQTAEFELGDEYSDFIVIGARAYLLGYDTVNCVEIS